ncbi:MAG: hypothetical protein IKS53_06925 [Bacteroidales bacterium]|nr:hypothetical protein [Bacteroidales bacterium]
MKKVIMIAAALMMFAATAKAQVFIIDDDEFTRNRETADPSMFVELPQIYNSAEDWYVPAGEGIFVLAGLAGAYLLGKRKKEQE